MFNRVVPNQRNKSKVFIGGYFDRPLAAGVSSWLKRPGNKRSSASDFLYLALVEKLRNEGIPVEVAQKTKFGSTLTSSVYPEHAPQGFELNESAKPKGK